MVATAAAALLVVSLATASPVLDVEVNATSGAYRVVLNGETWLRSGQLRAHLNGEWHATGANDSRTPSCGAARNGTDQTGGDMIARLDNSTGEASCCAACLAKPGCNAWVRGPPHNKPPTALPVCFLIRGAQGTKLAADRTVSFVSTPPPGTLALDSAPSPAPPAHGGIDRFGPYVRAATLRWIATSSAGAVTCFDTSFRVYTNEGGRALVLEQSIPAGAAGTSYRNVSQSDGGKTLIEPFLAFPSFKADGADAAGGDDAFSRGAGWVTWQGTQISQGFLPAGGGAPPAEKLGLDSGPVVIVAPEIEAVGGGFSAVVVAPVTHFKGAVQLRSNQAGGAHDWVAGVSGEVTSVPAGFRHETMLFAGAGVTDTMLSWGALMQKAFNTSESKVPDLVTQKVGYWTDNGAFYYGDAYPQSQPGINYNLSCCTKAKLLAAHDGLAADGLPMSYMQLDDWWYTGPHPTHGGVKGVKCVDKWVLPEDTYPGGLDALRADYGAPFLLYGPYFCRDNMWNQTLVPAGADAGVPFGRAASQVFYEKVFRYALAHGGFAYEVDFMNKLYLGVPEFRQNLDAATDWQAGMNAAAAATGLTVQFCMMHPSDLLNTLQFSHVTNGRASPDYASSLNWFIGHSSLLFEAVGLRPSKDNWWSGDGQTRQPGFHEPNPGTNGELNAILATMSTGPVGPADGAGQHNATRLRRSCGADGRILGTARPLTPIDATYRAMVGGARLIDAAALWSANSHPVGGASSAGAPGNQLSWHVLGVDVNVSSLAVLRDDLYPAPAPAQLLAVRDFHRAAPCAEGVDAVQSGCLTALSRGGSNPALLAMDRGVSWPPFGTHMTQLYTVSPLVAGEWGLLGELDKFVPISHARFSDVRASAAGVSAAVAGAAGEVVVVTALQPVGAERWAVATQQVMIAANGTGLLCLPALS